MWSLTRTVLSNCCIACRTNEQFYALQAAVSDARINNPKFASNYGHCSPSSVSTFGFSSCVASRLWQDEQSLEIVWPSEVECRPSWQRKQPGKSLWPKLFG